MGPLSLYSLYTIKWVRWHEYCLVINAPTRFKSFVSPPYLHIIKRMPCQSLRHLVASLTQVRKMSDLCPKQALP